MALPLLRALALASVLAPALAAQATAPRPIVPHHAVPGHEAVLDALDLEAFSLQRLAVPSAPGARVRLGVQLGDEAVTLELHPYEVRGPDYRLLVQHADGALVEAEPGPVGTYRGVVAEWPGSRVAASLRDGRLEALVALGEGLPMYGVQPARPHLPGARDDEYVVHLSLDARPGDWTCAQPLLDAEQEHAHDLPAESSFLGGAGDVVVCEIACDADTEYYQANGSSVGNTEADILDIINRTEEIYEVDVGVVYEVTTILVRTAEPDPYNTTNPSSLLGQFRTEWSLNQLAIPRDIAHFFTGKNLDGSVIGIASLGVICNLSQGYGLSQSKFSGNIISRTALTAHELGHNWSAGHCNGQSDCSIMCSGLGGCTGVLTSFGEGPKSQIIGQKGKSCLEDLIPPPPPTITDVSPDTITALDGGEVVLTGSSFKKVQAVTMGGVPVVDLEVLSQQELRFTAPPASQLGTNDVVVENVSGPSAPAGLEVVPVAEPVFRGPSYVFTFGLGTELAPAVWEFAGAPGQTLVLLYGLELQTAVVKGETLLTSNNAPLIFPLNAAGVGTIVVPAEAIPSAPFGAVFYEFFTQGLFFGSSLQSASGIVTTEIY